MDYKNLDDFCKDKKKYYQIQLNNDKLIIKYIGKGNHMADIVINENFGKNNQFTLYSCIYELNDFNKNKLFPLILLTDNSHIYTISIELYDVILDQEITNFNIFFTQKYTINKIFPLDKNINKENIIETLMNKLLDLQILIF
jgi:hypothetical protein